MTMTDHAKGYVVGRKALGLSFREQERILMRYAEFADARGDRFVRADSALDWAGTATSVREAQKQLRIVRAMAVFLHVGDDYLVARKRRGGPGEHLFALASGRPVRPDYLTQTFVLLVRRAGVRGGPGPRLHDLRHNSGIFFIPHSS